MYKSICKKLGKHFCKHEFIGKDMKLRNEQGYVYWDCCKCRKTFKAESGLDILKNGKCIGGW